ncbi:MAG: FAD-binding oxidoreductase [Syntrophales bacterium]|nr:FAD-binding oxidoreductase [Syntrophales bacterium]MDD5642714.1 FAD-binding oxidoreductase [Syntrophales bacterium]
MPQVIVLGAGILGLAGAYHILSQRPNLNLVVIDRLPGPGRGNTARSAAAYRDLFSSPLNRALSQGAIAFYEKTQQEGTALGLQRLGYLWLLSSEQVQKNQTVLDSLTAAGINCELLEPSRLARLLPGLKLGDIAGGLWGRNCGILNPNLLCRFYAARVREKGGEFIYNAAVTGFITDSRGHISGVKVENRVIAAETVVVATGAWMGATLKLAGLEAPVMPRKRQLFAVAAGAGALNRLLHTPGFNAHGLLPLTILPGGAYLRPAPGAFIMGYANPDQPPGLEDNPKADEEFFLKRLRPLVAPYFPAFRETTPQYAWAGHYADHPADSLPFVDWLGGALVVGGASGSGIMKADSLGRIVAGLYCGQDRVELGQGRPFRVQDLALSGRDLAPEGLII